MNFSLFFSLNTFQTISTLTAEIFLSFSTIRSQISSLKLYAILVSLFFLNLLLTTEAMGTGGLRAYSLSHSDKVNAGAKPAKCTSASL